VPELAGRTVLVAGPDVVGAGAALQALGARTVSVGPETSSFAECDAAVAAAADAHGSVDVLLLPVPPRSSARLARLDADEWRAGIDAVTRRSTGLLRAFARHRVSAGGGGHVVSFSSSAVFDSDGVGQASMNAAVLSLTSGASATLAPHGIAVNCIVLGGTEHQGGMPRPDTDDDAALLALVAHLASVEPSFTGRYLYCAGRDIGLYAMPLTIEQAHLLVRLPEPVGPDELGAVLAPLVEVGQA
jgi:NAD(P)-dependent dehydrogenase (short-subunit alcohol dehydrogenase family)